MQPGRSFLSLIAGFGLMAFPLPTSGAENPAETPVASPTQATNLAQAASAPPGDETNEAQRTLRAYLQLQEQLHSALLAIDQARQDAEATARRNAETLAARLKMIEQTIAVQRERELESMQSLNRLVLIAVAVFAGICMVALFWTGWLQLRAMNRLAEVATALPSGHALGFHPAAGALGSGDVTAALPGPAAQSSARLLGVIEQLERRVRELEQTTHSSLPSKAEAQASAAGSPQTTSVQPAVLGVGASAVPPAKGPEANQISLLLGKGQALLNLGQADQALQCFDAVLALDPTNAEGLVRKGSALERLDRLEDAIACYDRAIALNHSLTLAYLQKGSACNRLERFDEALQCYEQALRTHEKG
jgi:tetratricopeptide (TPR) repeat protein